MTRKARIWTGSTLAIILILNYAAVTIPLFGKSAAIQEKSKVILIKQAKSGEVFRNTGDEYIFDVYRKEKAAIDRRLFFVNIIALSFLIVVTSWTLFGALFHKERK